MKTKVIGLLLSILLFSLLNGCGVNNNENVDDLSYASESINELIPDIKNADDTNEIITLDNIPAYSDKPYVKLDGNVPDFSDDEKQRIEPFEIYSDLDVLGRCGEAYANICSELMPTEERGSIGNVKPSGWHTEKYNDLIDGNYLYNRCHLIAYQLAGENANEKNLITGTRYLNTIGMLPFENMVNDYVDSTSNHVLYRVTPIFEANNLVASGVQIEAWSVEDNGEGICFNVYCYNVQPGIDIDYLTGESQEARQMTNYPTVENKEITSEEYGNETTETIQVDFVINKNTMRFHKPTCSSVNDIAEYNKESFVGTAEELIEQGYVPCKRCLPSEEE